MKEQSVWCERRERGVGTSPDLPYEIDFQSRVDRSRITHSSPFRRLQGKTQVMGVREHDFFRTRLTHSLEVAQIGASLTHRLQWLSQTYPDLAELAPWIAPEHLIESACLAHDIGHPPFGHNGELVFNYYMHPYGGFEGNGQTLRILARLGEYSRSAGYDLCRRTLLAVLKYPVPFSEVRPAYPVVSTTVPRNLSLWAPPKCIHDDEASLLDWILQPFGVSDRERLGEILTEDSGKKRSAHKSLDCSVMELADDIAYGVHDLEDALAMGLLKPEQVVMDLDEELKSLAEMRGRNLDYYHGKLLGGELRLLKQAITNMVQTLVFSTRVDTVEGFCHPLLRYRLVFKPEAARVITRLKRYVFSEVIDQPRLNTLAYKGRRILHELFEALLAEPHALLPRSDFARIEAGDVHGLYRGVADYLASMTDSEAGALYQRLYLPGQGSVFGPF